MTPVFVAGAVAVTAVAVCLSMYTIGATARYDGVELRKNEETWTSSSCQNTWTTLTSTLMTRKRMKNKYCPH